ncbi:hypothetical protein HOLleu_44916 [Holothuria leucospilota]|uniref:Uncharacterized protein n=1 Tax=Holothuria leucospilota TaxID=206669 RepID=A0A9Q0YCS3_HOLLE|nr:hypothetical protein HOLleu_44916 [Holothuria leucospilota]
MSHEDDPGLRQSLLPSGSKDVQELHPVSQSPKMVADQEKAQSTVLPPAQRNEFSDYMAFPTKGILPPQVPKMFQYQKKSSLEKEGAAQNENTLAAATEDQHESFVKEIQNYSEYLKDLMQGEITRLTEANEELRRRLSERSLRHFDEVNLLAIFITFP